MAANTGMESFTEFPREDAMLLLKDSLNISKFWRTFGEDQVAIVLSRITFYKFKSGETVMAEDEEPTFLAILVSGSANVYTKKHPQSPSVKVGTVHKGALIGENGLFESERRTASVVSSSSSTVVGCVAYETVVDMYLEFPDIGLKLIRLVACSGIEKLNQRCLLNAKREELSHVRTCSVSRMSRYLSDAHQVSKGLGEAISDKELDFLAKRVTLLIFEGESQIIHEGELANYVFFILEGTVSAFIGGAKGQKIGSLNKGSFVGETAFVDGFLAERPRGNDVFASSENVMLAAISYAALPELNSSYPLLAFKMFHKMAQETIIRLRNQVNAIERRGGNAGGSASKVERTYLQELLEELKKKEDMSWSLGTGDARLSHSRKVEDIFNRRSSNKNKARKRVTRPSVIAFRTGNFNKDNASDSDEEDAHARENDMDSDCTFEQALHLLNDVQSYSQHFNGLSANDIEWMAQKITLLKVRSGELIVKEGEASSFMALILNGTADFIINANGQRITVGNAKRGEIMGEMGLFEGGKRSADIVSTSDDTVIAAFRYEDLISTNISYPELGLKLLQLFTRAARQKLLDRITKSADEEISVSSTHDHVQLYYELKSVQDDSKHRTEKKTGLYHDLQDYELRALAKHMKYLRFQMNSKIFEKGAIASCLLFILHGEIEARVGGLTGVLLGKKSRGEYLGENSFLEIGSDEIGTRIADVFSKNFTSCAFISFREVSEFNQRHPMIVLKMIAQMAEGVLNRIRTDIRKLEKDAKSPKTKKGGVRGNTIGNLLGKYRGKHTEGSEPSSEQLSSLDVALDAELPSTEGAVSPDSLRDRRTLEEKLMTSRMNANQIEEINKVVQQMKNEMSAKDEEILLLRMENEELKKRAPSLDDPMADGGDEDDDEENGAGTTRGANGLGAAEGDGIPRGKRAKNRLEWLLRAADNRIKHLEASFAPLIRSSKGNATSKDNIRHHLQQEIKRLANAKKKPKSPKVEPATPVLQGKKPLLVECSDIKILNTGQLRPSSAPTNAGGFSKKYSSPRKINFLNLAESPKASTLAHSPFVERFVYSPYHNRWEKVKWRPNYVNPYS